MLWYTLSGSTSIKKKKAVSCNCDLAYLPCHPQSPPSPRIHPIFPVTRGSLERTGTLFILKRSIRYMWKCTAEVGWRTSPLENGICFFYTFSAYSVRASRHFRYFEIKFSRKSVFCKKKKKSFLATPSCRR